MSTLHHDSPASNGIAQVDVEAALRWLEWRDSKVPSQRPLWRTLIALRTQGSPAVAAYRLGDRAVQRGALNRLLAAPDVHTIAFGTGLLGEQPEPGRRGRAADVVAIQGFHADFDEKRYSDQETAYAALRTRLAAFRQPTALVATGHGWHLYFDLAAPWSIEAAADRESAKRRQLALAQRFDTDHTIDVSRAMRLPGTVNRKDPLTPVLCEVVACNAEALYRLEDFPEAEVGPPRPRGIAAVGAACSHADLPAELDPAEGAALMADLSRLARVDGGLRFVLAPDCLSESLSHHDFAAVCLLLRRGFDDSQVLHIARTARLRREGGEMTFKNVRDDYWAATLSAAEAAMERESTDEQ